MAQYLDEAEEILDHRFLSRWQYDTVETKAVTPKFNFSSITLSRIPTRFIVDVNDHTKEILENICTAYGLPDDHPFTAWLINVALHCDFHELAASGKIWRESSEDNKFSYCHCMSLKRNGKLYVRAFLFEFGFALKAQLIQHTKRTKMFGITTKKKRWTEYQPVALTMADIKDLDKYFEREMWITLGRANNAISVPSNNNENNNHGHDAIDAPMGTSNAIAASNNIDNTTNNNATNNNNNGNTNDNGNNNQVRRNKPAHGMSRIFLCLNCGQFISFCLTLFVCIIISLILVVFLFVFA